MFTGIIHHQGKLAKRAGNRLTIAVPQTLIKKLRLGGSLAVNGVCLTAEAVDWTSPLPNPPPLGGRGTAGDSPLPGVGEDQGEGATNGIEAIGNNHAVNMSVMPETLRVTMLGRLPVGTTVNLELPLRLGDPLDGHLVTGHVDGMGTVRSIKRHGNSRTINIAVPPPLARYLAPKGSIAVDGVSLTIQSSRGSTFTVGLIPETLRRTTLHLLREGNAVNIEIDLIARYVQRSKV